jgi:hypothetical protein
MGKRRLSNLVVQVFRMRLLALAIIFLGTELSFSILSSADPPPSDQDTLISEVVELEQLGSIWNEVSTFFFSLKDNDSWRDESPILVCILGRRLPPEEN